MTSLQLVRTSVRRFSRDANDRFPEVLKIKDGFEGAANATDWKLLRVPLP